jgi:hypothetical protein
MILCIFVTVFNQPCVESIMKVSLFGVSGMFAMMSESLSEMNLLQTKHVKQLETEQFVDQFPLLTNINLVHQINVTFFLFYYFSIIMALQLADLSSYHFITNVFK